MELLEHVNKIESELERMIREEINVTIKTGIMRDLNDIQLFKIFVIHPNCLDHQGRVFPDVLRNIAQKYRIN